MRILVSLLMVLSLCLSIATARGEDVKPVKPDPAALAKQIATQLASGDSAARAEAVASMHKVMALDPRYAAGEFRRLWLQALTDARMFQDIDELAVACMTTVPLDLVSFETIQEMRVRMLLQARKPERALAAARGLFNIASMSNTGSALLLVTECLNAAHPGDQRIAERFKAQQLAGAAAPATSAGPPNATQGDSLLLSIKTEGEAEAFDLAARRIFAEDYQSLCIKGYLFLLADEPAEARLVLDRAYAVAPEGYVPQATENLARCMKAQDGAIGRANAWILALRPRPDTRPVR